MVIVSIFALAPQSTDALGVELIGLGGLYWALAGIVAAIVGAVLNAWVLLVEILR